MDEKEKHTDATSRLELGEVMKFPTSCSSCQAPAELAMHVTTIPHFKEVILMCMVCSSCGYRTNEIKGGGGISESGSKIILQVRGREDLDREVVKSDTAGITIPELELELQEGGLNGFYTTVEGLIEKIHDQLERANPFASGDNARELNSTYSKHERYKALLRQLKLFAQGEQLPFSLVITDPLANSFVGPRPQDTQTHQHKAASHDSFDDPGVTILKIQRTFDQNEALSLNDIRVGSEDDYSEVK